MAQEEKIIIYQTNDGTTLIDVKLEDDTVWLTANQMAALFERDEKTVRKHINNVFFEGELTKENNTHFLRVEGVKQLVAFYSLDVICKVKRQYPVLHFIVNCHSSSLTPSLAPTWPKSQTLRQAGIDWI